MFEYEIDMRDVTKKVGKISGKQFDRLVVDPVLKDMAERNMSMSKADAPERSGALKSSFYVRKVNGYWHLMSNKVYAPIQQWGWPSRFKPKRFATKPIRVILGRASMRDVEKQIKKTFNK